MPENGLEIAVASWVIPGIARSYGDGPIGTLVAIIGSSGRLEIAQVGGHASLRLGLGEGDLVWVRRRASVKTVRRVFPASED